LATDTGKTILIGSSSEGTIQIHQYRLTCRAVLAPLVIIELFRRGVYRAWGGSAPADGQRHLHHLRIQAETESHAVEQARRQVEETGGDASDIARIEVVDSN
jgi:hypothetical protein